MLVSNVPLSLHRPNMKDSFQDFSKQVRDGLEVLRASLSDLRHEAAGAEDSLRRVARSIARTAAEFGIDHIEKLARAVEEADSRPDFIAEVRTLMASLEHRQKERGPARTGILIVDDDPISALLLKSMLKAPERDILTAKTAAEAEEFMGNQAFDLLVLDLMLPDADGRDFLLKIRENPASAAIPVVIYSGLSANQAKAECLALGADDYIEKPVEFELARSVVARQLRGASEGRGEALVDPATGVPNRAALGRAFEAVKTEDAEGDSLLSLASIEILSLSDVLRTQGRSGRDQVLKEFSKHMAEFLGESDLLMAEPDGHVLVLFPERSAEEAGELLRGAREGLVGAEEPDGGGDLEPSMDFSAGVADVSREKVLREGIARADLMLSHSRSPGGPQVFAEGQELIRPPRAILLVEDDRVTATLIKHRLERDGFEILHFDDGKAAYEAVAEGLGFALAIFDVKLPGMDGFELLQRARELPHFRGIPVIMLTSMGREADIVRGFELGANDYVLKPFSSVELVARIHRSLGE